MRSGFGRIDDDIQRRARKIRAEQGEEAAREFEAKAYGDAASGLGHIAGGAAAGAVIGSVIPVLGTMAGFVIGAMAGGVTSIVKDINKSKS